MTLEQTAYLAQILGVILVVVSLVYLARQLNQNTELARVAAGVMPGILMSAIKRS